MKPVPRQNPIGLRQARGLAVAPTGYSFNLDGANIASRTGNIFDGLWYSIIIAVMPLVVGLLLLPETKDRDITK